MLTGTGFIVHVDSERCILCSCAHILMDVMSAAQAGSALDPMHHGVAVGFGDPVVWQSTATVEHFSPPPNHPLAPLVLDVGDSLNHPPLHHPQLDLAVLVMARGGTPAEWLVALPLGDSLGVHAGDERVSMLNVPPSSALGPPWGRLCGLRAEQRVDLLLELGLLRLVRALKGT